DRQNLWRAIWRHGPSQGRGLGSTIVGTAQGTVSYQPQVDRHPQQGCRLTDATVKVHVLITLPEWRRARFAPESEIDYWKCVRGTVTVHELRHAQIWRETAEKLDREFGRLSGWMPCSQLGLEMKASADEIVGAGMRRQRQFDEEDYSRRRYDRCVEADEELIERRWPVRNASTATSLQIDSGRRRFADASASATKRAEPASEAGREPTTQSSMTAGDAGSNWGSGVPSDLASLALLVGGGLLAALGSLAFAMWVVPKDR
ncbi:MAG: DUF922 domain-containing Zn-dependent protease, partial [Hyphomicrobiaceae bacterium]|nr:DUF922 domain-containing Zn-dependent protease [Hyphomicrobiaceae bacterium]